MPVHGLDRDVFGAVKATLQVGIAEILRCFFVSRFFLWDAESDMGLLDICPVHALVAEEAIFIVCCRWVRHSTDAPRCMNFLFPGIVPSALVERWRAVVLQDGVLQPEDAAEVAPQKFAAVPVNVGTSLLRIN